MITPLHVALAVALSSPLQVDTIRVGAEELSTLLPVGVDTVDAYIVRNDERRPTITFVQTIAGTPKGFLVVQENVGPDGSLLTLDSIEVGREALGTLWHGDVTPTGSRHVAFSSGRMTGVHTDSLGSESQVDTQVPEGLFDYSLLTVITDRLPLSPGYRAVVAAYDISRGAVYVPIHVVAEETVRLGGSTHATWRMEVDLGQQTVTRWVERSTGRELRWSVELGDGARMVGERRGQGP